MGVYSQIVGSRNVLRFGWIVVIHPVTISYSLKYTVGCKRGERGVARWYGNQAAETAGLRSNLASLKIKKKTGGQTGFKNTVESLRIERKNQCCGAGASGAEII